MHFMNPRGGTHLITSTYLLGFYYKSFGTETSFSSKLASRDQQLFMYRFILLIWLQQRQHF